MSKLIWIIPIAIAGIAFRYYVADLRVKVSACERDLTREDAQAFHRYYRSKTARRDMLPRMITLAKAYDKNRTFQRYWWGTALLVLVVYAIWRSV